MNNLRSLLCMKSNKVTFIGTESYRTNFRLVENSGVLVFRSHGKTGTLTARKYERRQNRGQTFSCNGGKCLPARSEHHNCLYFCTKKAWLHGGALTQLRDAILDLLK